MALFHSQAQHHMIIHINCVMAGCALSFVPLSAEGWPAVCDSGISWSYSFFKSGAILLANVFFFWYMNFQAKFG